MHGWQRCHPRERHDWSVGERETGARKREEDFTQGCNVWARGAVAKFARELRLDSSVEDAVQRSVTRNSFFFFCACVK